MTDDEIMDAVTIEVADTTLEAFIPNAIERAKTAIVARLFPFTNMSWDDVDSRFHGNCVTIATYLVNKHGAEGELAHSEAGISRTYASADIPSSYFAGMVPKMGVPK